MQKLGSWHVLQDLSFAAACTGCSLVQLTWCDDGFCVLWHLMQNAGLWHMAQLAEEVWASFPCVRSQLACWCEAGVLF